MDKQLRAQLARWDRFYKEQTDFYHRVALRAGLSDAAYWVLYWLRSSEEPVTQSSLCRENFFSKQTINSAVAKLQRDGLVQLTNQKGNGNRKIICLTAGGLALCEQYTDPLLNAEADSFRALTEQERELLVTLSEKQLKLLKKGMEPCL